MMMKAERAEDPEIERTIPQEIVSPQEIDMMTEEKEEIVTLNVLIGILVMMIVPPETEILSLEDEMIEYLMIEEREVTVMIALDMMTDVREGIVMMIEEIEKKETKMPLVVSDLA
jgi:hypothetical protein